MLGFTFGVEDDKGDVQPTDCLSAISTSEAKQYIEDYVKPGRTVTIDAIHAKDPGGKVLNLPALGYHIK